MESIHRKSGHIQWGFSICGSNGHYFIIRTRFGLQVNKRNAAIALYLISPVILCYLIHAGTSRTSSQFWNQFIISANECRRSIQTAKELIQHIQEILIIFGNHLGSGQIDHSICIVFCRASCKCLIQSVKAFGINPCITIDKGIIEKCLSCFDFLCLLQLHFAYNTAHIRNNSVNLISSTKHLDLNCVAFLGYLRWCIFFIDLTKCSCRLCFQSCVAVAWCSPSTSRGYRIVKLNVFQNIIWFLKFINNAHLQIILDVFLSFF